MQRVLLILYALLVFLPVAAQKQANNWYFGNKAGLNFNQLPPTPLLNNSVNSDEGTAAISDNSGKLLFYTNGLSVINRKNTVMKNGSGIMGDVGSTDNVVIVPAPGNDSIYYLFTVGSAYIPNNGFRYCVININLDAGFGEVVEKNISIEPLAFEKLAAIRHCNNKDVWVVIHKWSSDEYLAYLISNQGINLTPVVSHTGLFIQGNQNNTAGTLKFSLDGKKLVAAQAYENNVIELMDFDNSTGSITNPVVFHPDNAGVNQNFAGVYGAEFSPSGNLLYVTDNISLDDPGVLYQFDISSHNAATIFATKQALPNPSSLFAGGLQMGPDHKIYMAMVDDSALSVIDNPDIYGIGCNFRVSKIFLGQNKGGAVRFGLPHFVQNSFNPLTVPYDFTRKGGCLVDSNITFMINRINGIDSVKWDFGDGKQSQVLQPVYKYSNGGIYDVKLIVYKIDCSGLNDTIVKKIWVASSGNFLGKDTSSCNISSLQLGINPINGANYLWNDGEVANTIVTNSPGIYWLSVEQNGCTISDSVKVSALPQPVVKIRPGLGTTVCPNEPIVLSAANSNATQYLWSTGESTSAITINKAGQYYVTVTKNLCTASDTLQVVGGDCEFFIPNSFTPNKDGINDYFGILGTPVVKSFSFKIFNRYGQIVFSTNNPSGKWDGTYRGKAVPNGAYTWSIIFINGKGYTKWLQGTVLVVR